MSGQIRFELELSRCKEIARLYTPKLWCILGGVYYPVNNYVCGFASCGGSYRLFYGSCVVKLEPTTNTNIFDEDTVVLEYQYNPIVRGLESIVPIVALRGADQFIYKYLDEPICEVCETLTNLGHTKGKPTVQKIESVKACIPITVVEK